MKKIAFIILMGTIALGSCKKVVEKGDLDKQITIHFPDGIDSRFHYFEASSRGSVLKDFDKRDYKYVDSITLNLGIWTPDLGDTAYVRLYNITDNVEIANSRITGHSRTVSNFEEFNSNNIIKSLPDKRISLAVQIISNSSGKPVFGISPYLKLRRN